MNALKTKARARKIRALALSALLVAAFVIPQATLAVDGGGAADPALNKDSHSGLVPESTPQADGAAETAPADKTGDGIPADKTGDGIPADKTGDDTPADKTGDNTSVGKTGDGIPADETGDDTLAEKTGDDTETGDNTPNKDSHSGLVPESTPQPDGATETAPANEEIPSPPPLNPVTSTILAFTPLEDEVRYQRGEAPTLPETVEATIESNETVAVPVSWKADGYAPGDTGLHVFIATPGAGYAVADGVELPRVTAFIPEPEPKGAVSLFSFGRVQGLGTAESPLGITNADQLAEIAALVNKGTSGAPKALEYFVLGDRDKKIYLELRNDIDLAGYGKGVAFNGGKGWIPIGLYYSDSEYSAAFRGSFDGGGHKVTGLYINYPGSSGASFVGLFGCVYGSDASNKAEVKNLGVDGEASGNQYVGGVAGYVYGSSTIENCYMAGAVSGRGAIIGGVVGYVYNRSTVEDCYMAGAVSGTNAIGGVVGMLNNTAAIENCYMAGTVSGSDRVGGVAGYIDNNSTVMSCYATGAVSGRQYAGGVAGDVSNSRVASCAALNPSVTINTDTSNLGRVVGYLDSGTLSGNSAFSGVALENSGVVVDPIPGADLKDGADVSKAALQNLHTAPDFPASLTQAPWVYTVGDEDANKLPGLPGPDGTGRAIGMPPHLLHGFAGSGTGDDPWRISDAAELALLADYVNDDDTDPYSDAGACYELMNDIDLSVYGAGNTGFNDGKGWIPIGDDSTDDANSRFRGVFDGGGHKVIGLYINDPGSSGRSPAGLFGYVYGTDASNKAVVKNLGVDGEASGYLGVGGVAGMLSTAAIENCHMVGAVSGTGNFVGGVVGAAYSASTVKDCYATGAVSGSRAVGGVAGYVYSSSTTIENCYATGAVSGTTGYAGGVAGYLDFYSGVTSCAALNPSVTINADTTNLGRVVGFLGSGTHSGNAAFSGMTLKNSSDDVNPTPGANLKDGADVDKAALQNLYTATGFPASLTQGPWVYTDGDENANKLPGLPGPDGTGQAIGMPPHLLHGFKGAGTEPDPWQISSAAELALLADYVNDSTAPYSSAGACYKLMNDIDLSAYGAGFNDGKGWIPIGDNSRFRGVFDGDSHKVTGLYISDAAISYAGLFGYVYGTDASNKAVVKDLGVDGEVSGSQSVGGVAGYVSNHSTVEGCYETGAVSGTGDYVGGVVGYVDNNSTVTGCYAMGAVSGYERVGGVAGYVNNSTVTGCYAMGAVSGNGGIGGVAGYVNNSTVTDCYALGAVSGAGNIIGGVVGVAYNTSTVKDCYATGAVSGNQYVGGVAGHVYSSSAIEDCYATGAVSGNQYVGGVAGSVYDSKATSCAALNIGVNKSATTDVALGRAVGALSGTNTLAGLTAFNETPVTYSGGEKTFVEGAGDATMAGKDGLGYTEGGVEADGAMAGPGFMDPVFWTGVMGWGGDAWDIAA
ncbi:MAG: Ig-like domain-containing protein, partial [Clostridiales Family XIII bacterium]|nr:Ig-like domain-containing protein [Clostridiales Family XIII bacterium]